MRDIPPAEREDFVKHLYNSREERDNVAEIVMYLAQMLARDRAIHGEIEACCAIFYLEKLWTGIEPV